MRGSKGRESSKSDEPCGGSERERGSTSISLVLTLGFQDAEVTVEALSVHKDEGSGVATGLAGGSVARCHRALSNRTTHAFPGPDRLTFI
jgi:hypothetical protein